MSSENDRARPKIHGASRFTSKDLFHVTLATAAAIVFGREILQYSALSAQFDWTGEPPEFTQKNSYTMLVLADIHAGSTDTPPRQYNTAADYALNIALRHMIHYPFDAYANLGDSIKEIPNMELANAMQLQSVFDTFARLPFPGFQVVGNHDAWGISRPVLRQIFQKSGLPLYGSMNCGTFKNVWIPIEAQPGVRGSVSQEVLEWLSREVKPDIPWILYTHYPPRPQNAPDNFYYARDIPDTTPDNWRNLWNILKRCPPRAVICGHMHQFAVNENEGIRTFILPSFTENNSPLWPYHPSVYTVLEITPEARRIQMTVRSKYTVLYEHAIT